jgi:hypothetical protein
VLDANGRVCGAITEKSHDGLEHDPLHGLGTSLRSSWGSLDEVASRLPGWSDTPCPRMPPATTPRSLRPPPGTSMRSSRSRSPSSGRRARRWRGPPRLVAHRAHRPPAGSDLLYFGQIAGVVLRDVRDDLSPLVRPQMWPIHLESGHATWWSFIGARIRATQKYLLVITKGWRVIVDKFLVRVEGGVMHDLVNAEIDRIVAADVLADADVWRCVTAMLPGVPAEQVFSRRCRIRMRRTGSLGTCSTGRGREGARESGAGLGAVVGNSDPRTRALPGRLPRREDDDSR